MATFDFWFFLVFLDIGIRPPTIYFSSNYIMQGQAEEDKNNFVGMNGEVLVEVMQNVGLGFTCRDVVAKKQEERK